MDVGKFSFFIRITGDNLTSGRRLFVTLPMACIIEGNSIEFGSSRHPFVQTKSEGSNSLRIQSTNYIKMHIKIKSIAYLSSLAREHDDERGAR